MKLDQTREIIQMAHELEVPASGSPVHGIVEFCLNRIAGWIRSHRIISIQELENCICKKLGLTIIEVWSDADLAAIVRRYVDLGEPAMVFLAKDLDKRFATLFARRNAAPNASDQYVAVIDCRTTEKACRRWFSRWHEIAHILTQKRQMLFPVHRSEHSPEERLMDEIASRVGFYEPIFGRIADDLMRGRNRLSFIAARQIREAFCKDASIESTLYAIIRRLTWPAIVLEAELSYKKAEQDSIIRGDKFLFESERPIPKLRVKRSFANDAAKAQWGHIHPNMRVPEDSIVAAVFHSHEVPQTFGEESLEIWQQSGGQPIGVGRIYIETHRTERGISVLLQAA